MNKILSCDCHEPEGIVTRSIYSLELTQPNLMKFWEASRKYPTLFSSAVNDDFNKFCNLFLYVKPDGSFGSNGLFYVVDDFVGVYYLTDIMSSGDATAHYTFFDRRHRGRVDITKALMKYVFNEYHFNRLTTVVPTFAKRQTHKFVERIGFSKEGQKRNAAYYAGRLFDEMHYGLLRNEALDGKL